MTSFDALLVWLDGGVCSQLPSHSFWLAGRPLPLCARDLGLFGAFLLALPFARTGHSWRWLAGFAPLLVDGANSFAFEHAGWSVYAPSNPVRLATGALAGLSLALLLAPRWPRGALTATATLANPYVAPALLGTAGVLALIANAYLALALAGTAGVLALIAGANVLAWPRLGRLAWGLALPELAALAAAKYGLLAVLR